MYAHLTISIWKLAHRERIVKVFCVIGVNGHRRDSAEVTPALRSFSGVGTRFGNLLGKHRATLGFESFGLGGYSGREVWMESLVQDERAHLNVVDACAAYHLLDCAAGHRSCRGPVDKARQHLVARFSSVNICNLKRDTHPLIVGFKDTVSGDIFYQCPDKRRARAPYDLGHATRGPGRHPARGVSVHTCKLHPHDIAVEGMESCLSRYEEVLVLISVLGRTARRSIEGRGEETGALLGETDRAFVGLGRRHLSYSSNNPPFLL